MKRSLVAICATSAAAFTLSGAAFAATADPHASCSGLAGASRAGQAGAEAEMVSGVLADAAQYRFTPGANFSGFSRFHDGTAEVCLA